MKYGFVEQKSWGLLYLHKIRHTKVMSNTWLFYLNVLLTGTNTEQGKLKLAGLFFGITTSGLQSIWEDTRVEPTYTSSNVYSSTLYMEYSVAPGKKVIQKF